MLESLTIHNYAIIDEMSVEFSRGLNVLTGETGAGKSIVVDALELLLGARASNEMIRSGADSMKVTGVFTLDSLDSSDLEEFGIDKEDGLIILRREVRADGDNRCFLNDRPVTLKAIKSLGDRLVDLHGQHDHQSLLNSLDHVKFLDSFGGFTNLAERVACLYVEKNRLTSEIRSIEQEIEYRERDRELRRFQIEEIESACLVPVEDETLSIDIQRLSRATELKALGWEVFQRLSEAEGSVEELFGQLSSQVNRHIPFDKTLEPFMEKLDELAEETRDIAFSFRNYAESVDDNPAALAECEDRLALIERLKKKYGPSLEDVFKHLETIREESRGIENIQQRFDDLKKRVQEIEKELAANAGELSIRRKKTAPFLSKEVQEHLAHLGMDGAQLIVDVAPWEGRETVTFDGNAVPVGKDGFDRVEFLISTNPGEPPKSLVKVASGGEISRVMLSLKLALVNVVQVPTMVFDEIDIGVSGKVAESMGWRMLQLSEARQVVTITHLPQIAAMANKHFSARKIVRDGRTSASLVHLGEEERTRELASLLSGDSLADTALAHARELLEKVRQGKTELIRERE